MYAFAVTILLGLALFTLVNVLENVVPALEQNRVLVTIILAIAGAVALDYSVFAQFGTEFRTETIGTYATGMVIAGTVTVWRTVLGYLGHSEAGGKTSAPSRPRIAA